jgi:hypothetical protein
MTVFSRENRYHYFFRALMPSRSMKWEYKVGGYTGALLVRDHAAGLRAFSSIKVTRR